MVSGSMNAGNISGSISIVWDASGITSASMCVRVVSLLDSSNSGIGFGASVSGLRLPGLPCLPHGLRGPLLLLADGGRFTTMVMGGRISTWVVAGGFGVRVMFGVGGGGGVVFLPRLTFVRGAGGTSPSGVGWCSGVKEYSAGAGAG